MQYWKLCLVGAVLALAANADQDLDGNLANDGVTDDTANNDVEDVDNVDVEGDDLEVDDEEDEEEEPLDLTLTEKEQPLFEAEAELSANYDDQCFRCIYEGYAFCSEDGKTGSCMPAFCAEKDPIAEGKCNLKGHSCANTTMLAVSQCWMSDEVITTCPSTIVITDAHVNTVKNDVQTKTDNGEDLSLYPLVDTEVVTIPAGQGCRISVTSDTSEDIMGGFQLTTRPDEVLGLITVLTDLQEFDETTSKMFSEETKDFSKEYTGNVYV